MSEKKIKFTVIDAVIILVILAALAIGVKKVMPMFMNADGDEKIDFTVLIQKEDIGFADAITVGDNVTVSLTEKDGGTVKDVKAEPAVTLAYNSIDGAYSNEIIEGKYDVYITIEAEASVSDLALKTGGTAVKVGAEIPVRGKGYASMGYVIDIND
ncbi:MAG: DUF4330 domain-containing protein [Clostridia bacterium]|jgi:hypothetical protein|nr:DUF4330 domain-containing protein [Clostridia bacterium]MCI9086584.1 DUF4330 domain-containing protein [Clostridia bacterium]NDO18953.1 DUF4330 domain-containing protein [Lachnospiraceae bacterium MD329]